MIINIAAHTGEGKTKTALAMISSLDLMNNKKVVYLSQDQNVSDWIPDITDLVGKEKINCFRPMFAKDLENAISILPYIDHLPYDTIVLDGFSQDFAKLKINGKLEETLSLISSYTTNHRGKIIVLSQLNASCNA